MSQDDEINDAFAEGRKIGEREGAVTELKVLLRNMEFHWANCKGTNHQYCLEEHILLVKDRLKELVGGKHNE